MSTAGTEIRNPDFVIWFPRIEAAGGEVRCSFDVMRAGAVLLHEGTEELCRTFLSALGVAAGEVQDWDVSRICTPFFTDLPDSADWRDRYRISWRVTIRAHACGPVPTAGTEPVAVVGTDPTARVGRPDRIPGDELCEVLAAEVGEVGKPAEVGPAPAGSLSRRLSESFPGLEVSVREMADPRRAIRIGRVLLGPLPVEPALDRLDAIVDTCAELGLATHIPRYESLRARAR